VSLDVSVVTDTPHLSPPCWSSMMDLRYCWGMISGVSAAGTGVSEDTAAGVWEVIPGRYCGFSDDLVIVLGNLKEQSRVQQHALRLLHKQQQQVHP